MGDPQGVKCYAIEELEVKLYVFAKMNFQMTSVRLVLNTVVECDFSFEELTND